MRFGTFINTHPDVTTVWVCLVHYTSGAKKPQMYMPPTECTIRDSRLYKKTKRVIHKTTDYKEVEVFLNESDCYQEFYRQLLHAEHMVQEHLNGVHHRLERIKESLRDVKTNYPEYVI